MLAATPPATYVRTCGAETRSGAWVYTLPRSVHADCPISSLVMLAATPPATYGTELGQEHGCTQCCVHLDCPISFLVMLAPSQKAQKLASPHFPTVLIE